MKFKDYINEKTLNRKLSELIAKSAIPLSTPMMDRLGYSYNSEAYHMSNAQFLANLKKLEGSKKQLSCFTKGGSELMRLPSNPNILLKLDGNVVIGGNSDIWSLPDNQGRRWLDIQNNNSDSAKMRTFLQGFAEKIIINLGYEINYKVSNNELKNIIDSMTSKDRSLLYRQYIDKVESWIDKGGYKMLSKYLKSLDQFEYNEVVLNKIKILGAYSIEGYNKENEIKSEGIKYLGVISKNDISNISI